MMFTPEIVTIPLFSALDGGMIAYPTIGAVLAWMLIAAFVGSALGLLGEAFRGTTPARVEAKTMAETRVAPALRECCETV